MIESQLAKLHAELGATTVAQQTLLESVQRRVNYLPNSKNYFSYHQGALEDGLILLDWWLTEGVSKQKDVEGVLLALVQKTCTIYGLTNEQIATFNIVINQAKEKWSASISQCEYGE